MNDDEMLAAPPREGYRALSAHPVLREDGDAPPRLTGHFARFNTFNEINSVVEGRFLERIQPGAFRKTLAESRPRMLFQHGRDPQIGDKPIGAPEDLREDDIGPFFDGPLFPSVPPLIVDGLRAGQYGVSYRFSVVREDWDPKPKRSDVNPLGLPERTIREARVYEFGPVTFPADSGADIAVRSMTDEMSAPTTTEPVAPSGDAEAEAPHLPERRDEPADPPPAEAATIPDPPTGGPTRSATVYDTREDKVARINELRAAIAAQAEEYPGVMPEDAQARWDADNKELDTLRADVDALDARRARVEALEGSKRNAEAPYSAPTIVRSKTEADLYDIGAIRRESRTAEDYDQKLRDNALRASETMRFAHPDADADATRAKIADLIDYKDSPDKELARRIITTGSPQYRRDFNRYVKSGGQERGTALAVGVDGTGGYSVPVAFDPTIVAFGAHTAINPYRRACRVETIVGTDTWQALSATAITAAYATEAAVVNEQGPTFTRPEYIVKRAQAFVSASYEMMQDRADLAAELGVLFQEAKDNVEEQKFAIGASGGATPVGMFVDGQYTAIETVANNVVAAVDAYAIEAGLPVRHRMNAAWFMGRGAIRHFQGLETAMGVLFNGINYANAGGLDTNAYGNTGLRLLGYPVWESPSAPVTMTTNAAIVAVLCDPKSYVIVDRVGMSVRVIPDLIDQATALPTGQSGIFAFWRNTGARLNVDAGRQIKVNAP